MLLYHSKGLQQEKNVSMPKVPRVSVVGEINEETGMLNLAVARCSSRDNFCRKIGKTIAEGRLKKEKCYTQIPVTKDFSPKNFVEIAKKVAEEVIANKTVCAEEI